MSDQTQPVQQQDGTVKDFLFFSPKSVPVLAGNGWKESFGPDGTRVLSPESEPGEKP